MRNTEQRQKIYQKKALDKEYTRYAANVTVHPLIEAACPLLNIYETKEYDYIINCADSNSALKILAMIFQVLQ
jgi:hypothetical protein